MVLLRGTNKEFMPLTIPTCDAVKPSPPEEMFPINQVCLLEKQIANFLH